MEHICLVHRKSSQEFSLKSEWLQSNSLLWQTCQRQILFFNSPILSTLKLELHADDEFYFGEQALTFLIEIVCGLHSKIKGETEIYGQFKKLIEDNTESEVLFFKNKSDQNFVFNKIKELREKHLYNLGSQSYGSILRKKLAAQADVSILGSGLLAVELLPWLKKNQVSLIARNPEKDAPKFKGYTNVQVKSYQDIGTLSSTLIIAAQVSDEEVLNILQNQKIKEIFDFRANQKDLISKLPSHIKLTHLEDIFTAIQKEQQSIEARVNLVKESILKLVSDYANQIRIRPLGWDDLCA